MNRPLLPALVALAVAAAGCQRQPPPGHIFHNGKIVTVDAEFRIVEAMALRDGRVVAVGTNADILTPPSSGWNTSIRMKARLAG